MILKRVFYSYLHQTGRAGENDALLQRMRFNVIEATGTTFRTVFVRGQNVVPLI